MKDFVSKFKLFRLNKTGFYYFTKFNKKIILESYELKKTEKNKPKELLIIIFNHYLKKIIKIK